MRPTTWLSASDPDRALPAAPEMPSYPAPDVAASAAAYKVLVAFFPDEQAALDGVYTDVWDAAALIYWDIDITAGRGLGQRVAAEVLK